MRPIRRAAVSGLFALWLSPLPALPGGQPPDSSPCCARSSADPAGGAVEDAVTRLRAARRKAEAAGAGAQEEATA